MLQDIVEVFGPSELNRCRAGEQRTSSSLLPYTLHMPVIAIYKVVLTGKIVYLIHMHMHECKQNDDWVMMWVCVYIF